MEVLGVDLLCCENHLPNYNYNVKNQQTDFR